MHRGSALSVCNQIFTGYTSIGRVVGRAVCNNTAGVGLLTTRSVTPVALVRQHGGSYRPRDSAVALATSRQAAALSPERAAFKLKKGGIMPKYILYARKSTDVEDKQVLSIDAQIVELKDFAKKSNLDIVDVLIEKRTAKIPGRPVFGKMLERIKYGEADGILAWLPDRLSRNSIDSG